MGNCRFVSHEPVRRHSWLSGEAAARSAQSAVVESVRGGAQSRPKTETGRLLALLGYPRFQKHLRG